MSINRIEISVDDKKRYGLVAFLVDRTDFLEDIDEIRNKLKLKKIPFTFPTLSYHEANNVIQAYEKGACRIYDVYICFLGICKDRKIRLTDMSKTLADAYLFSEVLVKKYKKRSVYLPVILSSILVGIVAKDDILPTNTLELNDLDFQELQRDLEAGDKRHAIIIDYESTWQEVRDTFDHIQKYLFGTKKIKEQEKDFFNKITPNNFTSNFLTHTRSNIKEDRDLYWRNLKGESYFQIAKNDNGGEEYYVEAHEAMKNLSTLSDIKSKEYQRHLRKIDTYKDKVEKSIQRYKQQIADT